VWACASRTSMDAYMRAFISSATLI
jgi:hypothetical protein